MAKVSSHPAACFTWYVQAWVKVYRSCRHHVQVSLRFRPFLMPSPDTRSYHPTLASTAHQTAAFHAEPTWQRTCKLCRDVGGVGQHKFEMASRAAQKQAAALTRLSDLEAAIEDQRQVPPIHQTPGPFLQP